MFWRESVESEPFQGFRLLKESPGKAICKTNRVPRIRHISVVPSRKKTAVTRMRELVGTRLRELWLVWRCQFISAPRSEPLSIWSNILRRVYV